jgi:hypothetical protein
MQPSKCLLALKYLIDTFDTCITVSLPRRMHIFSNEVHYKSLIYTMNSLEWWIEKHGTSSDDRLYQLMLANALSRTSSAVCFRAKTLLVLSRIPLLEYADL